MSQAVELIVEKLNAIEEIKKLHAQYVYSLDERQLETTVDLFADNFIGDYGPYGTVTNKADLLELLKGFVSGAAMNCHSSTTPLIEVNGEQATAIWYLFGPQTTLDNRGLWIKGKYENEYVKVNAQWKISVLKVLLDICCTYEDGWGAPPAEL